MGDNYTLFTTDVQVSDKSAKMLNAAGGVLLDSSVHVEKPEVKREMVERAQQYLLKSNRNPSKLMPMHIYFWEIRMFIKITMRKHWKLPICVEI